MKVGDIVCFGYEGGEVHLLCRVSRLYENSVAFGVINGGWNGTYRDGNIHISRAIKATSWPAKILYIDEGGKEYKRSNDYNEFIYEVNQKLKSIAKEGNESNV